MYAAPIVLMALLTVCLSAHGVEEFALVLFSLIGWIAALAMTALLWLLGGRFPRLRAGRFARYAIPLSVLLGFSVMATNWPLHAAYAASRPAMERIASDLRAGRPVKTPCRAGWFTIERAEIPWYTAINPPGEGIVCLWTDYSPGGSTGFVQCPPDQMRFNLWSSITLDGRWQFIAED